MSGHDLLQGTQLKVGG